jgi:hypothetical protein
MRALCGDGLAHEHPKPLCGAVEGVALGHG